MSEQFADEYQEDEYVDDSIPGDSETADTWEEPDEYQQGFDEGAATVGVDAYDAGIARDLIQGSWQLQEEKASEETLDAYQRQLAATERDLGRPLSAGEWAYLEHRAYQPDLPVDVGDEIRHYQENTTKAERMQNSIEAMWGSPDTEEVLSGPEDNYGLDEGASPHERRAARDAWSLQRARINRGELQFDDE